MPQVKTLVAASRIFRGTAGMAALAIEDVDDIIVRTIELGLGEKREEMFVARQGKLWAKNERGGVQE